MNKDSVIRMRCCRTNSGREPCGDRVVIYCKCSICSLTDDAVALCERHRGALDTTGWVELKQGHAVDPTVPNPVDPIVPIDRNSLIAELLALSTWIGTRPSNGSAWRMAIVRCDEIVKLLAGEEQVRPLEPHPDLTPESMKEFFGSLPNASAQTAKHKP